jgi:cytochrome b
MKKVRVYELSLRLYHVTIAIGFMIAFVIAKTVDDESPIFSYHMLVGFILGAAGVARTILGLWGGRFSRFKSLLLGLRNLMQYGSDELKNTHRAYLGHNPASSWIAVSILGCILTLAGTGILMTGYGLKEQLEDLHGIVAHLFLLLVVVHVTGVMAHTLRHKDPIGLSMVSGRKSTAESRFTDEPAGWVAVGIFALSLSFFGAYLLESYDQVAGRVTLFGHSFKVGRPHDMQSPADDDD